MSRTYGLVKARNIICTFKQLKQLYGTLNIDKIIQQENNKTRALPSPDMMYPWKDMVHDQSACHGPWTPVAFTAFMTLQIQCNQQPPSIRKIEKAVAAFRSWLVRDRKGNPKNLCDKDFAELSGELSGAICLKTLVLLGRALELFRKFFGAVRVPFLAFGVLFLALDLGPRSRRRTYGDKRQSALFCGRFVFSESVRICQNQLETGIGVKSPKITGR